MWLREKNRFLKRGGEIFPRLSDMYEFTVSILGLEIEDFHRSFPFHAHCTLGDVTHPWIKAGRWRRGGGIIPNLQTPFLSWKVTYVVTSVYNHLLLSNFQNLRLVLFCILFKHLNCYQTMVDLFHLGQHREIYFFYHYFMVRNCFDKFWSNFAFKYIKSSSKINTTGQRCDGSNCVPLKFMCWRPYPHPGSQNVTVSGGGDFQEENKLK